MLTLRLAVNLGVRCMVPITERKLMSGYEKEPVEIIEETLWVVYDPWEGQDIASFSNKNAAELFAQEWMVRNG